MVISSGRVTGVVDARKATKEQIGFMMTGGTADGEEDGVKEA